MRFDLPAVEAYTFRARRKREVTINKRWSVWVGSLRFLWPRKWMDCLWELCTWRNSVHLRAGQELHPWLWPIWNSPISSLCTLESISRERESRRIGHCSPRLSRYGFNGAEEHTEVMRQTFRLPGVLGIELIYSECWYTSFDAPHPDRYEVKGRYAIQRSDTGSKHNPQGSYIVFARAVPCNTHFSKIWMVSRGTRETIQIQISTGQGIG